MILSDKEILCRLKYEQIQIWLDDNKTIPTPDLFQGVTLEGHLADNVQRIRSKEPGGGRIAIDLKDYDTEDFADNYWEKMSPAPDGYYPIHPKEFLLAYTEEKFRLPHESKVYAFVEGKSSLARIGLGVHFAPIIHCGFMDDSAPQPSMLELYNHSENVIYLRPGKKICQFFFASVEGDIGSNGANKLGRNQPRA
jgi:dCTP deaminase